MARDPNRRVLLLGASGALMLGLSSFLLTMSEHSPVPPIVSAGFGLLLLGVALALAVMSIRG